MRRGVAAPRRSWIIQSGHRPVQNPAVRQFLTAIVWMAAQEGVAPLIRNGSLSPASKCSAQRIKRVYLSMRMRCNIWLSTAEQLDEGTAPSTGSTNNEIEDKDNECTRYHE